MVNYWKEWNSKGLDPITFRPIDFKVGDMKGVLKILTDLNGGKPLWPKPSLGKTASIDDSRITCHFCIMAGVVDILDPDFIEDLYSSWDSRIDATQVEGITPYGELYFATGYQRSPGNDHSVVEAMRYVYEEIHGVAPDSLSVSPTGLAKLRFSNPGSPLSYKGLQVLFKNANHDYDYQVSRFSDCKKDPSESQNSDRPPAEDSELANVVAKLESVVDRLTKLEDKILEQKDPKIRAWRDEALYEDGDLVIHDDVMWECLRGCKSISPWDKSGFWKRYGIS